MEVLQTVPDELFSDSFAVGSLGLDDDPSVDATQQDVTSKAIASVLDDIIDNVIFGFSLEIHRMCKKGVLFLEETDKESIEKFRIVDVPGLDIFGQELKKSTLECVCPSCDRLMAASRFAPHLEKCMGMGRCSSRVASRRIANNIHKQEGSDNDSLAGDEHDNDWSSAALKRSKKLKKEKQNSGFRGRGRPTSKSRPIIEAQRECHAVLDGMSDEQRGSFLQNFCAASIDPINKRFCANSLKCSVHTDGMRQAVRQILLTQPMLSKSNMATIKSKGSGAMEDEVDVDIDTYDNSDIQALRDAALWDKDITPTASPADSTSTVNSSGSRKRGRKKKSKRRD
ncbi:ataxin-7-like protein 3 [Watersipora subatra]|uniref:ataxin-7-like protein 3 n=1 Tax=Watersipora subatra TaxID=2589382 RepID=UPI00355C142F